MLRLPAEHVNPLRPFFEGRPVCVTGGAGFIGGHLVDALLALGASVSVIDDLSNSSLDHLASLLDLEPDRLRIVRGSILDDAALASALAPLTSTPPTVIFHLAAVGSVPRSLADPARSFAVNATGTLRVLNAARPLDPAPRVVFAASSSAYGDSPTLPRVESAPPRPISPYAASKVAGEHLLLAFAKSFGLSTVSLRFFNVFGPRQPADSDYAAVIPRFARALLNNEPPTIFGDGSTSRDFTFVGDVVLALLRAASAPHPFAGEVINVGSGRAVTLTTLAQLMAAAAGVSHLSPRYAPARVGDVPHSLADLSCARQLLNHQPATTLETGLAATLAWARNPVSA